MRLRAALLSLFLVTLSFALAPTRVLLNEESPAAEEEGDEEGEEDEEGGGW